MNLRKVCLFLCIIAISQMLLSQPTKTRLIVLADMGNEPDEEQQIVHLIMYSNEFDIEGLIAVTGKFLNPQQKNPYRQVLHPELFLNIIKGYEGVFENLKTHANGWPEPNYLRKIVVNGQAEYGIEGTGTNKSSDGSKLIVESLLKPDPRPLYIVVNAGSNTLAQALIDFKNTHTQAEFDAAIAKLRVYENGAQDNAGAWICFKFPEIHWTRSNFQTYCYGGPSFDSAKGWKDEKINLGPYTWEPYPYSGLGQHLWTMENIIGDHGTLGYCYPLRNIANGKVLVVEGGGTIPWLGLINQGLSDINHVSWGGWSGRFTTHKVKNVYSKHKSVRDDEEKYGDFELYTEASDTWVNPETDSTLNNVYVPVWRWRRAIFNDFKCRMDWCVEKFENANHNPVAAINGDNTEKIHFMDVKAGKEIVIDASASTDPDKDVIDFKWWIYNEAGTYQTEIKIANPHQPKVSIPIPPDAKGKTIHVILELKDNNKIACMYDYRRVVLNVK